VAIYLNITPVKFLREGIIKAGLLILSAVLVSGCTEQISTYTETGREAKIYPDYSGIAIPPNIAPLNFTIQEPGEKYVVRLNYPENGLTEIRSKNGEIRIPEREWKKILEKSIDHEISLDVFIRREGVWSKFSSVRNMVTPDPIDKYMVYRLIYPGYEIWYKQGIYQRNLESFEQSPVMINEMSRHNCMNCHCFAQNDSRTFLFHMRGKISGTIILRNGKINKVDTKTPHTISAGVYPAWHPGGRYVAFSTNEIMQFFHTISFRKVEVIDTLSNLILFDAETNTIKKFASLATRERLETFPAWSHDGRYLYFCSAGAVPERNYKQLQYDLMRVPFNQDTRDFGALETVIPASSMGKSVTYPRISPDGRYILFCFTEYGNFTTWHPDSDLYTMDIQSGQIKRLDLNSNEAESHHAWSSSGRWICFSSRRDDGFFALPYIAYFDRDGKDYKPFILPQKDPEFYKTFIECFNLPEFATSKIEINPHLMSRYNDVRAMPAAFESAE
jgi:hypothetical protein